MLEIVIYAHGNISLASTRLRAIYLFGSAKNFNYITSYNLNTLRSFSGDVLYLQMVYKPQQIFQAIFFRALRKQVIFDIDDTPTLYRHKLAMFLLSNIASAVTVDSFARKDFCDKQIIFKKSIVIRDPIDINPMNQNNFAQRQLSSQGGILWIGNRENLHSIEPMLKVMESQRTRKFFIASNFEADDPIKDKFKEVNFLDWEIDISYDTEKIDASFMVLSHLSTRDPSSEYKSENKMVTAIASGLIPVVSSSPAYLELAIALDAKRLVFNSLEEVPMILNNLEDEWMKNFSIRAKAYIKDHYSHESIFQNLRALVLENNCK